MGKGKTLLLIDGHALAFRQFYALERTNMKTSSGTPTWAVFGFFKALFDLLKNKKVYKFSILLAKKFFFMFYIIKSKKTRFKF